MTSMERFYQLTCRPILTEKGSDDMGKRNAYHFRVPTDAGAPRKSFGIVPGPNTSTRPTTSCPSTAGVGSVRRPAWVCRSLRHRVQHATRTSSSLRSNLSK